MPTPKQPRKFYNADGSTFRPDFRRFVLVTKAEQLKAGMVLIDKNLHKRTILSISDSHIWLGHKGGYQRVNRLTGKEHPLQYFIKNFKNWIFQE